jgi:hypothetical protein
MDVDRARRLIAEHLATALGVESLAPTATK